MARQLLGMHLCTNVGGNYTSGVIVETEAYRGPEDKASHAYGGRRTNRTEVMYSPGGIAYVYLCYGIHHLFNVVTAPKDMAHAILVRAIEPLEGKEIMRARRGGTIPNLQLTNGPGKLTQALGITRVQNGQSLLWKEDQEVWLEAGRRITTSEMVPSKRIGIEYAKEWKDKFWRFYIKGNPFVSIQ